MTEYKAWSLVIDYLALSDAFGEAVWNRIDMWIGVSPGLIVLAYFAPERLSRGIAILVIGLYLLISTFLLFSCQGDLLEAASAIADAQQLNQTHGLSSRTLDVRLDEGERYWFAVAVMLLFMLGLFGGTTGYAAWASCSHTTGSAESNSGTY